MEILGQSKIIKNIITQFKSIQKKFTANCFDQGNRGKI